MTLPRRSRPTGHHRAVIAAGSVIILGAAGGGSAIAAAGHNPSAPPAAPAVTAPTSVRAPTSAIFTDTCTLTKVANDDPLLDPAEPGRSMRHDFFGNVAVDASSTPATLRGGDTTCSTSADSSAYWTPVLSQHGAALRPSKVLIYWRTPGADASTTHTMPPGISMIAGNEQATAPQNRGVTRWQCIGGPNTTRGTSVPRDCPAGQRIRLVVSFPSCWDGHELNGANQQNVVYPTRDGTCPTGHTVRIPQVVFHETYPTGSAAALTLSMGPAMEGSTDTAHVDFMNGWKSQAFDAAARTCITGGKACGRVSGPDATPAHPQDLVPPQARSHGRGGTGHRRQA